MADATQKSVIRRQLREMLAGMDPAERHRRSLDACARLIATPEFEAARVIMIYLSTPQEVDTAPLALRAWQDSKTVTAPRVSWNQRRMIPIEITSLHDGLATTAIDTDASASGIREPIAGNPIPADLIDLVIVPGLGFTPDGHRIGRGMGFYDRFLAQESFIGLSCGLAFEKQVVDDLPVLDHDMPLSMLVSDRGVRRFSSNCIRG